MAMLRFLDPRGSINPENRPLIPGLDSLEGKVIGIIDNGQSNCTCDVSGIGELIQEKFRPAEVIFRTKPTHMQGAPKTLMEELINRCDAVITGLGA